MIYKKINQVKTEIMELESRHYKIAIITRSHLSCDRFNNPKPKSLRKNQENQKVTKNYQANGLKLTKISDKSIICKSNKCLQYSCLERYAKYTPFEKRSINDVI